MRRFLFLTATLFVLPLFACGSKDGTAAESCADEDTSCEAGLTCRKDFPGTFCAQSCASEGDTAGCPGGTVCSRQFTEDLLCSLTCDDDGDCREGYVCKAAGSGSLRACQVRIP